MPEYPYLSLTHIAIDPELALKFPRKLAYYHLALPIARDEDEVTVVMAYPDNRAVVSVLQATLQAEVVPVQGSPQEIRAALDRVYPNEVVVGAKRLLSRGETAAVVARLLGGWLTADVTEFQDGGENAVPFSSVAREGQYDLIVVDTPDDLPWLVRNTPSPLLLVRHPVERLNHLLVVLRGHSPDQSVLDWAAQLGQANSAGVTLLTVNSATGRKSLSQGLVALLSSDTAAGEHVARCAQQIANEGLTGWLKFRQGKLEVEVGRELVEGDYDLMAVAAEAYGDTIQRILDEIDQQTPATPGLILIVKPHH